MKKTRFHYFQHVPFEDPCVIKKWADDNGFNVTKTEFFKHFKLPDVREIDWLVIMGGPMNIYEYDKYPWLAEEKTFIKSCIDNKKKVLGVCLGAQLIAGVLGAKVTKNKFKEIGWFKMEKEKIKKGVFSSLPDSFISFHWHGDTFSIPKEAIRIARSKACLNQGFSYDNDRVVALQFHLEVDKNWLNRNVKEGGVELEEIGPYIQGAAEMLSRDDLVSSTNGFMYKILDRMASK